MYSAGMGPSSMSASSFSCAASSPGVSCSPAVASSTTFSVSSAAVEGVVLSAAKDSGKQAHRRWAGCVRSRQIT